MSSSSGFPYLLIQSSSTDIAFSVVASSNIGATYGRWTVEWWRWAFAIPKSKKIKSLVDRTGEQAGENQPSKDVWYLAGKLADEDINPHSRSCTIQAGRSILFSGYKS